MTNSPVKKFLPLLLITLLSLAVKAQTNVSGFISANTTWTTAGSPYIVVSNALVSQGDTLIIEPGVVVKFDSACALQIDGEMVAIGNAQNRITFTSNQPIPAAGDWAKLHFSGYAADAVFDNFGNYISGCIMKYCDVLYAGGLGYGAIHIESSSPYISRCNISNSQNNGILSVDSICLIDSSIIQNCNGVGIYFLSKNSVTIRTDTIENCNGGILAGSALISNNYFFSNYSNSVISINGRNVKIIDNYFVNNMISSEQAEGLIYFYGSKFILLDNSFINNILTNVGIISTVETVFDTVNCNLFLNNRTEDGLAILSLGAVSGVVSNNLFDSNNFVGSYSGELSAVIASIESLEDTVYFINNTIRNDSAPLNILCAFGPNLSLNKQLLRIENNNFVNNVAEYVVAITGGNNSNVNINSLYMKYNNFIDPNSQYELYNDIPYGSQNLYPDSNYWGGTSTAHIDSVIFDYFDSANLSVVYYQPILTTPVVIDTSCSGGIPSGIKIIAETISSTAFPNPFSNSTKVKFGKDLLDAEVDIYNVFGQKVKAIEHFSGNEISIDKGNLSSGIYIYEIVEKQAMVANGKLVIE